ncbi:MAG: hypothetical protein QHC79_17640 [Pseudosphingobacterium sp.]|nr:hypothetical protein [Pseudosphingobacterium sp.]
MFKSPFSFEGRIRRTEYGLSYLTFCFSAYVLGAMFEGSEGVSIVAEILLIIPLLWFLWPKGQNAVMMWVIADGFSSYRFISFG